MVRPWLEAGHECTIVDLQHPPGEHTDGLLTRVGADLLTWEPMGRYDVGFAFPPCTHLAGSGARWWRAKGPAALAESMALVDAARRILADVSVWLIENPVGRLTAQWREPDYTFDPCDFGGYLAPAGDAYTKRTCLWTSRSFNMPKTRRVVPTEGSRMHLLPPGPERANLRSMTPEGFARAVYLGNRDGPAQTRMAI